MKVHEPGEKLATLVAMPSLPQRRKTPSAGELPPDHQGFLTEALRAKDARLQELLQDRGRFTHLLQNEVLEPLYRLEETFSSAKTGSTRQFGNHARGGLQPDKQVRQIIQGIRERILSLEADVITGFEFESELHQLAKAGRHFGNLGVSVSVDPRCVALLTQEEGRRLLCVARSLLAGTLRCPGVRSLDMTLQAIKHRIRFVLHESGTRGSDEGPQVNLDEIGAHVGGIGGRVLLRRRPRFELTVLLDTAPPATGHRAHETAPQSDSPYTPPQQGVPRHA